MLFLFDVVWVRLTYIRLNSKFLATGFIYILDLEQKFTSRCFDVASVKAEMAFVC